MSLTGTALLWLLGLLAVALFVVAVIDWPAVHPRPLRRAVRAVKVLLLNAVVLLLAFALLNDDYVFYTSWNDLFAADPAASQLHRGGTVAGTLGRTVAGDGVVAVSQTRSFAIPEPNARLQRYSVRDPSGAAMEVLVDLPAGYDPSSPREYPVIVGLHGFPGFPASFVNRNILTSADALVAQHRLAPTIFVIPQIDDPSTLDTECVNAPAGVGPQTDTWLSSVIPAWTVQHFHVRVDRASWATLGFSYGGWCAVALAMRHPDVFGTAISLEGYFEPLFPKDYQPLSAAGLRSFDLVGLARSAPPPIAIWLFASREDAVSYRTTAAFLRAVRPPLTVQAVVVPTGGHRFSVFQSYIPTCLQWLGANDPAFRG